MQMFSWNGRVTTLPSKPHSWYENTYRKIAVNSEQLYKTDFLVYLERATFAGRNFVSLADGNKV